MVSHWLAWISFGFSILLLLEFAARKSNNKNFIYIFRKLHRPFAIIMMITGLAHGTILIIKGTVHTAAIITGIVLFGCALYVCHTCIHRHRHKKIWMRKHRKGSVVLLLLMLIHLFSTHHF